MATPSATVLTPEHIGSRILLVRGEKVLLDADLANLYGVSTGRLNEQVKRNLARFPADFMFRLTNQELGNLKSQFAISSLTPVWGGRRSSPHAFTKHGALMAANVLNSRRAIEISIYVVRAFVRLRQTLAANKDLAKKLAQTRSQFRRVVETLRQLMSGPEPARRPIGFVTPANS